MESSLRRCRDGSPTGVSVVTGSHLPTGRYPEPRRDSPRSGGELSGWGTTRVLNTDEDGSPFIEPYEAGADQRVRIEIPLDIQQAKAATEDAGVLWRLSTRRSFESCLEAGFEVRGFRRDRISQRCWYLLGKGGSS